MHPKLYTGWRSDDSYMEEEAQIRILEKGPYVVRGNVPLFEKAIRPGEHGYVWEDVREVPHEATYALCRCGNSRSAPFCDGRSHRMFRGRERADRRTFDERAERREGPGMVLADDGRCSLSRFCHREAGRPWALLPGSDDPAVRDEIVRACNDCPSGRLAAIVGGTPVEEPLEPEIWVIQDPEEGVSGGIYVRGRIPVFGSNGETYEPRDRAVLCRCGRSGDMPFCDASHISCKYRDDRRRVRE